MATRVELLHDLLELNRPIHELAPLVEEEWGTEELVTLISDHIRGVLLRFEEGKVTAEELSLWAETNRDAG